jgi:hypothetical protein
LICSRLNIRVFVLITEKQRMKDRCITLGLALRLLTRE